MHRWSEGLGGAHGPLVQQQHVLAADGEEQQAHGIRQDGGGNFDPAHCSWVKSVSALRAWSHNCTAKEEASSVALQLEDVTFGKI
jgi:hypothetical protein